ncbi:hypothetical protein BU17DRAFT_73458 [Hysterangium stoloniferum]|nr:hypothetical protein BU17DRAFT_73458 [Hysterangium stoloniferum]
MSLPAATREISEHPGKNAVTDPVNKDKLHADIRRKLKLYHVIQALRGGKMPDNEQVDEALQYVERNSPVDVSKLSPSGEQLVNDVRDIIETARLIVKEKNADELLQKFIWHTRGVDASHGAKRDPADTIGITADKVKNDSMQAAHHLRTLLSLFLTNAEARKLISDFSVIGRDLLVRSADAIRPDEEALNRVDEPVSPNQPAFLDRSGKTGLSSGEEEKLKKARGAGGNAASEIIEQAKTARQEAQEAKAKGSNGDIGGVKKEVKGRFLDRFTGAKERVPEEYRQRAGNEYVRTKEFLGKEYFPKERRERFINRAKKVVTECQGDKDYQESIRWYLDTLSEYGHQTVSATNDQRDTGAVGLWNQGALKEAKEELIFLLSRFANGTSPQPAIDAVNKLFDLARQDEEMRTWLESVQQWMKRVLLEPGYVVDAQCNKDGNAIREKGRQFFDQKYKKYFDELFDSVSHWFTNLKNDPLNERFGHDWSRLTRSLLFDSEGSLSFKPELWADIRTVIIPSIIDKVGYVPIPRAEYSDENYDVVIENLTLSGRNLFPNVVSVEAHNFTKFSPYTNIHDENHHNFIITLGQIQADLRDVMFYFNKKSFPVKMRDSGLADVLLGGDGIKMRIHLLTAAKDSNSVFKVQDVHISIGSLKFGIRDSKHDALYTFMRPLATRIVKRQIQRALRNNARTVLELVDQQLVRVRDRMEEAKATEGMSRATALKELFNRQTDDAAKKAKEGRAERQSKFNIVPKKDSLLLPNEGNPHAWVRKQQEEEEVIRQGPEWRSPM